ncbi:bZIP transcription factor 17/28/49 [Marchantia polymorpha subsp. ruderalis]|uniref:BZIP domain-containing protein n=1 Tax=Marchantia polymorpha TaxID=3197 RepID=A0A2R6W8A5_MARPO|nr:hypothetical protein MARPO_0130s0030 [Marchantia polymorpha]PTQ30077.1 hypothetical protein MARPO_0130s0030 [Marchantia polymorpha]BBN00798.1 hypothetical protein Mp_2g02230 [Marchantia polymorpha subsp. ruderalis]BBN00799.1 hypothetical protein Mp_2g02230 [Marchantia polymorpha subsp. ruderalis]|eukprot:PTQ30075.1 hypothetical protein MARPO_0130s0030 [Marchantia polymorpha]
MEVEVVEADNGVNPNNDSSMAIDMAIPGGFEDENALMMDSSVETADLGEDWVSLFFDESYLNAMTTSGEVEQQFLPGSDAPAAAPGSIGNGIQISNRAVSPSTMILSSSPASASSGCPFSANVDIYPENHNATDKTPLPTAAAISPPPHPAGSPESTLSQASGASSCAVQPCWWGNEDLEEDGVHGSEEESSTSNYGATDPSAVAPDASKAPIQAQEVKGGAEPASSVGKIATGARGSVERSDRKRRSWEREEAENGQQQSQCAQSEIDRKGSESGDGLGGEEDDEKRQARLMRNRESAQLSRQRKKVYVDELEGRLRTMAATIAELTATITHLTAENVNLRRQLGFFYQPARPAGGMPIMQYPGLVRPVYPGAPMPPVPIPRLKPQQSLTKTPKRAKSTREPGEKKKVKKVASLATAGVMGLLCITMLLGPFDWGSSTVSSGTTHIHVGNAQIRVGGRVLTSWNEEGVEDLRNMTPREPWADGGGGNIGHVNSAGAGGRNGVGGRARSRIDRRNGNILRRNFSAGTERVWQSCSECYSRRDEPRTAPNLVEKLVATNVSEQVSLIVPRNNRLIKVDGNLIIRAVMAGDKAAEDSGKEEHSSQEGENGRGQVKQDLSRSSRSPPTPADHRLIKAISTQAQEGGGIVVGERQSRNVGAIREDKNVQKPAYKSDALASVSATPTFSQLVLGSLAGPVLSTGMCTEVFRFDTSPTRTAPNTETSRGSSSVAEDQVSGVREEKTSAKTTEEPSTRKKRDPYAVPLPPIRRQDGNGTEPVVDKVFKGQQSDTEGHDASTMVVSVFTGPQDVSAEDSRTGGGPAKGLSQIFVVVLVDSVKYITYSCMLPPTGSQVHVVAS